MDTSNHVFCGFCGARMTTRWYKPEDYDTVPAYDRKTGVRVSKDLPRRSVWACPNADMDDWQWMGELEDHDVEEMN